MVSSGTSYVAGWSCTRVKVVVARVCHGSPPEATALALTTAGDATVATTRDRRILDNLDALTLAAVRAQPWADVVLSGAATESLTSCWSWLDAPGWRGAYRKE